MSLSAHPLTDLNLAAAAAAALRQTQLSPHVGSHSFVQIPHGLGRNFLVAWTDGQKQFPSSKTKKTESILIDELRQIT